MAATKGHGNPNWTRDEIILAFDLYRSLEGIIPPKSDPRIAEFSSLLQNLPYHASKPRNQTFRNIDGVRFKLQNIRNLVTGVGLDHVSEGDRAVVREFMGDDERLKIAAGHSLEAAPQLAPSDFSDEDASEEYTFQEGATIFVLHKRRERQRSARTKLIKSRARANDGLSCEICGFSRPGLKMQMQEAFFEAHHIVPMSEATGQIQTQLKDLALLCACCHRAIHKLISVEKRWVGISEAKELLCCD